MTWKLKQKNEVKKKLQLQLHRAVVNHKSKTTENIYIFNTMCMLTPSYNNTDTVM